MAKKLEFGEGDFVVYPTHGVGRVMGIEDQTIGGRTEEFIVFKFEKVRMIVRVPVA